MQKFISTVIILITLDGYLGAQTLGKETILIETSYGNMKVKLYEETPLHKANFLKLARENFFDSLMFHRVIANFMIQGGDPLSRRAKTSDSLGDGDIGYTIPAEFNTNLIQKKELFVLRGMAMMLIQNSRRAHRNSTWLWVKNEPSRTFTNTRKGSIEPAIAIVQGHLLAAIPAKS